MTSETPGDGAPIPGGLVELRHALAGLSGRQRLDRILEHPDARALVQALPADELYHSIQDAGLSDATEIVQLASPEQFRTFLDLDAWRGQEVDPLRLLPWIHAARGSANDADLDAWRGKLTALDSELLSLLLRTALQIHDLEEDPDPEIAGDRFIRTPDGSFIVEFLPEGSDYVSVRRLVDDLYDRDPYMAGRILSAVRWELESDLQEGALRWREGRLADQGYPGFEEALSWFARPSTRPVAPAGIPERAPGFWLASFRRDTLLDRASAQLPADGVPRFEAEAVAAANATLVADRVDPSDPEAVRSAVESARTLLEMGLESLSDGDEEQAVRILATTPLKSVFQAGFARLLELRWTADRILREAASAGPVPALDSPIGESVAAARRRRPQYFPGLELPHGEWGSTASGAFVERPFRASSEVRRTAQALSAAEVLLVVGRKLGLTPPQGENPPSLATLYLTALANERLGRPFAPVPLPPAELPQAARLLETVDDARLSGAGAGGQLLLELARNRAAELAPIRDGETPPPGAVTALLLA